MQVPIEADVGESASDDHPGGASLKLDHVFSEKRRQSLVSLLSGETHLLADAMDINRSKEARIELQGTVSQTPQQPPNVFVVWHPNPPFPRRVRRERQSVSLTNASS
jgi:hypothetical protein